MFKNEPLQLLLWLNNTLTPMGCLLTAGFFFCLLLITRTVKRYRLALELSRLPQDVDAAPDIEALAGEDVITAQLDLARAYIEMGSRDKAKAVLADIARQGTPAQKMDAAKLQSDLTV